MDLLEYQAKELFRAVGIPVLPSQTIQTPRALKDLTVPYPVVLKSQVRADGRGLVGGVRCVENTIDGIAAAQAIFNLAIDGQYPKVLLAEAKYAVDRELYLAVTLNVALRRPVLLGSVQGGMAMQAMIDQTHQVVIEGEFSPFYGRQLALAMGLSGALLNQVSDVVAKMYGLLVQKDLDLVEINPLAVQGESAVMALDGKIRVNDAALNRHPDLLAWHEAKPIAMSAWEIVQLQMMPDVTGSIGVLGNGSELLMATLDQVIQAGCQPSCYVNIGGDTHHQLTPDEFGERFLAGLRQIMQQSQVRQILVNLMTDLVTEARLHQWLHRLVVELSPLEGPLLGSDADRVVPLSPPSPSQESISLLMYCGTAECRQAFPPAPELSVAMYSDLTAAIAALEH